MLTTRPARFRIDQIDMYDRDERAYKILQQHCNPATRRVEIKIHELTRELGCGRNTTGRLLRRLSGAGRIKIHRTQGRQGAEIEVLCLPSTTTSST